MRRALVGAALLVALGVAPATAAEPLPLLVGVVAVHPTAPDVVYSAGFTDRLQGLAYRSDDAGLTLRRLRQPSTRPFAGTGAIEPDPRDPAALYASLAGDGAVWRSADAGSTWSRVGDPIPAGAGGSVVISDLALLPDGAQVAVASFLGVGDAPAPAAAPRDLEPCAEPSRFGRGSGVFRRDAGGAWRRVLTADANDVLAHPVDPQRVYVTTTCGLYRSDDGARTFARVGGRISPATLVLDPSDAERLLAVGDDAELARSADGGRTWTAVRGAPRLAVIARPSPLAPSRLLGEVELTGDSPATLRPSTIHVSEDFGATWRPLAPIGLRAVGSLVIAPSDPSRVYAQLFGGVLVSRDGGVTWSAHGEPIDDRGPELAAVSPALRLQRTIGGRVAPRVRLPLRLASADPGATNATVRLSVRVDGRWRSVDAEDDVVVRPGDPGTAVFRLDADMARAVPRGRSVRALVRVDAFDDTGTGSRRWLRVTLTR